MLELYAVENAPSDVAAPSGRINVKTSRGRAGP